MAFGDYDAICSKVALPLCSLIGPPNQITTTSAGVQAKCYARSIELANTIIFQGGTDFMHILALIMTTIMVIHVRSKFTAVGMFILARSRVSHVEPWTARICRSDRPC